MRFHSSAVRVLCVAGIAFGAHAQRAAEPVPSGAEAVIRSETRVVLVDAVAVDKKNKFATDLTQKDFRIWEDGKEQKITSFSLESAGVSPERSSRHYIVLFFDTSTLGPSTLLAVKQDATRFVDTFASPDRYMAVIAYGGDMQVLQNFTPDATRIKNALSQLQNFTTNVPAAAAAPNTGGRIPSRAVASAAPVDATAYRRMMAALRTVAGSVGEIRGRKALVLFSGGVNADAEISTDIAATIEAFNRANVAIYGVNGHGLIGKLDVPGAKKPATILASLEHGFAQVLESVAAPLVQATDAGSADAAALGFQRAGPNVGGLPSNPSDTDASGATINTTAPNQDVLRALAAGTGGLMLGTSNNLPEELGRIAQEQDEYYLLGYTPTVDSAEGTCHTLQVKVDKGGLDVRARKGYCTQKPADPLAGKAAGKDLETRAAGGSNGNIPVKLQLPWFYARPNVAQVSVAMDIVPTAMKFQNEKGKLHGEFDLVGIAYKPDGSVGGRLSDTVKLDFESQQEADAFLKTPYHYANQFEIVPGQYNFRMAVGSGDQGFGKVEMPLTIDPWNGKDLSMSGLALSHDAHPVGNLAGSLDDLMLERVRPLVSQGMEVVPTGVSQFRVDERGFFYAEVYEPRLEAAAPAPAVAVHIRIRVLDRAKGLQIDDSGMINAASLIRPGHAVIPIAMALPIVSAGLPAGAYKLEVSAVGGAGQTTVVRTADFDVK